MASRAVAEAAPRTAEPGRAQPAADTTTRKVMTTSVIPPRQSVAILPMRTLSSGVVDVSKSTFEPSQAVANEIAASGDKGLDVRVIANKLTGEGRVRVRQDRRKQFASIGKGSMPLLNPWTQKLGGMHLNFVIANTAIKDGYASFKPGGGDRHDWLHALQKNASLLGGLGLKIEKLPVPVNTFENGKLVLGVTGIRVVVGGFVDAGFDLLLEDMSILKVSGSAHIDIHGAAKGQLTFDNTGDQLRGSVSLAATYKSFSGAIKVVYQAGGEVDVSGKAAYSSDKLSGDIQFVATDLDAANKFAKDAISAAGGAQNVQSAAAPGPVPIAKTGQKQRALAATGQLDFHLTEWFVGTVHVVVDGKGAITVIGKIAPPGEIELFKQRDWDKEIFSFEAKAYYGIPVVGNLNLFANISLHALAKLGPAKLNKIEILGTYSTDPEIQKYIQISGSLNISAYGGLRLRAEGGAGVEILDHDLKFGIGLNADVGVQAYADARPTIGYRDPGVFYISGVLDLVVQPILGLNGDFFIALKTPWWSPLSDDRWTWPLFAKEWPLTDPIGISASVKDYVLGSGAVPEIELKKPEFDPSKFMTSMVDKTLPDKAGGPGAANGTFKDDGSVPKPVVPPKLPAPKAASAKPAKKGAPLKGGKSGAPDPKAAKDQANSQILQKQLTALKGKGALTRGGLDKELAKIRTQVSGIDFVVQEKGAKWLVKPVAGGKTAQGTEIAKALEADKKPTTDASPNERSKKVKDEVRADLAGKKFADPKQLEGALKSVFERRKSEGLTGLRGRLHGNHAFVEAAASPVDEVANLPVNATGARAAIDFFFRFKYDRGATVLQVHYDNETKRLPDLIENDAGASGRNHAEDIFFANHLPQLAATIQEGLAAGTLNTKNGPVSVSLNLNRLPCQHCAPIIAGLAGKYPEIQFIVRAASVSPSGSIQRVVPVDDQVQIDFIKTMLAAGVKVEPLKVYEEVWKKIEAVGRRVKLKQVRLVNDSLAREVTTVRQMMQVCSSETNRVQELIEQAQQQISFGRI